MSAKKAGEIANAQELLRLTGTAVLGAVEKRESPDFQFHLPSGTMVGLEVAELADAMIAEGTDALRRLRSELQRRLEEEQLSVAIHLSVTDGCGRLLAPRGAQSEHVNGLLELVRAHLAADSESKTYSSTALDNFGIRYVAQVTISDGGYVSVGHRVHGRGTSFVQGCIDAKNSKADRYRASLPEAELWLLLVAGEQFRSSVWSAVMENKAFTSAFDRVFCLDKYEGRVLELALGTSR